MSLNKEAAFIANTLDQPFNHELKERVKDIYKEEVALVINKIANRGITEDLIIGYDAEVERVKEYVDPDNKQGLKGEVYKTVHPVPRPVRLNSDSMFTFVGTLDKTVSYPHRNPGESQYLSLFSSTGESFSYYTNNNYIYLNKTNNTFKGKYIHIESVFESPEEVLGFYKDVAGDDIQLPIPLDIKAMIRGRILETLGSIKPDNEDVTHEEQ